MKPSYVDWNSRLLNACLQNSVDADGRFYLNPHEMLDDEDDEAAEEDFCVAVSDKYASLRSVWRDPIQSLNTFRDDSGRPLCAAFLGVCVLAAERMEGKGYYAMLCKTLDQPEGAGHLPLGFTLESFENAWLTTLAGWLRAQGLYLQRPPDDQQRFVRLPKMHALLRANDLKKLPNFFGRFDYDPAGLCLEERVCREFGAWLDSGYSNITRSGRLAWRDDFRRPGIIKQILRVLERWDGTEREFTRRSAVQRGIVTLHLDLKPERVLFQAPRKPGFPDVFPFAGQTLRAVEGEDYQDLMVPAEFSNKLFRPYEQEVGSRRLSFRGTRIFAFVSGGAGLGYDQEDHLAFGENCAVLCRSSVAAAVRAFLETITDDKLIRRDLRDSLPDWSVFADFYPTRKRFGPGELAILTVESKQRPRLTGGLRLGQRQTWLAEAPPSRIEAIGEASSHATIDGTVVPLRDGRTGDLRGQDWGSGLHQVVLGERRSFQIVAGRLKPIGDSWLKLASDEEIEAALAEQTKRSRAERWLLLGSVPGQIAAVGGPAYFSPQWRLDCNAGALNVIALSDAIIAPQSLLLTARPQIIWAQTVLRFAGGRLGAATPRVTAPEARRAWVCYVDRARQICARHGRQENFVDD